MALESSNRVSSVPVSLSKVLLILGDATEADQNLWWVPLGLKSEKASAHTKTIDVLEKKKQVDIRPLDLSFYKLNDSASGVYRVNYPASRLETLGKQIAAGHNLLNASDRISLVADAAALAISGEGSTTGFLSLIENFKHETNFFVWDEVLKRLSQLQSCWYQQPEKISDGLRAFSMSLVSEKFVEIGWDAKPNEDYLTGQLRPLLIKEASYARISGYSTTPRVLIIVSKKKLNDDSRLGLVVINLLCRLLFVVLSLESSSVRNRRRQKIMRLFFRRILPLSPQTERKSHWHVSEKSQILDLLNVQWTLFSPARSRPRISMGHVTRLQ